GHPGRSENSDRNACGRGGWTARSWGSARGRCHVQGTADGGGEAAAVTPASGGEVEGRAVVNRSADQRQSEGDVHRPAKTLELEYGQSLVVVHGEHGVAVLQVPGGEQGIRRQGSLGIDPCASADVEGGDDGVDFLAAEVSALPGMGIEAANEYPGLGDGEVLAQRPVENGEGVHQAVDGDG